MRCGCRSAWKKVKKGNSLIVLCCSGPDDARRGPVVEGGGEGIRPRVEGAGEVAREDREAPGAEPDPKVAAREPQPEAGGRDERKAGERREREVVRGQRRDARELGLRRGEQVPPVVVVDRRARKPGVRGRHGGVAGQRVHEREVHELFGADDGRSDGPKDDEDAGRGPEEDRRELLLVSPDRLADRRGFVGAAAAGEPPDGGHGQDDREQRDPAEARRIQQQRDRPAQIRDDREAQGSREQRGVPAVAEVRAQHREDGEAQNLRRQGPCQNVPHAVRSIVDERRGRAACTAEVA